MRNWIRSAVDALKGWAGALKEQAGSLRERAPSVMPIKHAARGWLRTFASVMADRSASLLIIPAAAVLLWIDWARFLTLVEWMAFASLFVGFASYLSRFAFPQVNLTEMVGRAKDSSLCCAMISCTVIMFMAAVVIALAIWTKP